MNCPKCGKELETGPAQQPELEEGIMFYWAGCEPCGFYTSARTEEGLRILVESTKAEDIQ